MSMTPDRYRKLLGEFDALISHARAISDRLVGLPIEQKSLSYSDTIYTKLICHGISLRKLSPSFDSTQPSELWDVASACAVARALIEAYDALAYIGVHQVESSEREFRVLLWELHDQQRRLTMLEKIGSADPRVADIRRRVGELSAKLTAHSFYSSASKEVQGKVARGEAPPVHLSQRDLNAASGINHEYYIAATMWLSQYVHTFPLSLHQLMHFRAGEPNALHVSSMPLQYSMPFLAKAIEGMVEIWPEGDVEPSEEVERILRSWLVIAENWVRYAG
jgi:hypothetical protein